MDQLLIGTQRYDYCLQTTYSSPQVQCQVLLLCQLEYCPCGHLFGAMSVICKTLVQILDTILKLTGCIFWATWSQLFCCSRVAGLGHFFSLTRSTIWASSLWQISHLFWWRVRLQVLQAMNAQPLTHSITIIMQMSEYTQKSRWQKQEGNSQTMPGQCRGV